MRGRNVQNKLKLSLSFVKCNDIKVLVILEVQFNYSEGRNCIEVTGKLSRFGCFIPGTE